MKGFNFVPFGLADNTTVKWCLSFPLVLRDTERVPENVTVVSVGMSIQHAVSSIAIIFSSLKLHLIIRYRKRRTKFTSLGMQSAGVDWLTEVRLFKDNSLHFKKRYNHPQLALKLSELDNFLALSCIILNETRRFRLRIVMTQSKRSSSISSSVAFRPPPASLLHEHLPLFFISSNVSFCKLTSFMYLLTVNFILPCCPPCYFLQSISQLIV